MTTTEVQEIVARAERLGEECYRLPILRLAAEVTRLHRVHNEELSPIIIKQRIEATQLRARVAELEQEVKTTQELWDATGTDNTDLRAQLATAVEALESIARFTGDEDCTSQLAAVAGAALAKIGGGKT